MSKKCEHSEYNKLRVMDMAFSECRRCGFQWKGHKPHKETKKTR